MFSQESHYYRASLCFVRRFYISFSFERMSGKARFCAVLLILYAAFETSSALDDPTTVRPGDIDYTTQSFTEITDGVFYARAYDSFSDQVVVEGRHFNFLQTKSKHNLEVSSSKKHYLVLVISNVCSDMC